MTIKELLAARTAPGTWHWQAEGPGAGDIWLAGEPADPDHDHHILTPSVCESCSQRGARCLAPKEADARFIVYADRTIEAYEAVVEAARAQHYLYARDPNIERTDDDPAWCACGVPSDACGMLGLLSWLDIAKEAGR